MCECELDLSFLFDGGDLPVESPGVWGPHRLHRERAWPPDENRKEGDPFYIINTSWNKSHSNSVGREGGRGREGEGRREGEAEREGGREGGRPTHSKHHINMSFVVHNVMQ